MLIAEEKDGEKDQPNREKFTIRPRQKDEISNWTVTPAWQRGFCYESIRIFLPLPLDHTEGYPVDNPAVDHSLP